MTSPEDYFVHLSSRSVRAVLYRRFWLYPRICRYLSSGRALDIGCGLGDMLAFRADTIGVDINPKAVEWCQSRGLNARMMQHGRLPFQSGDFFSVILDNVLEHVAEPQELIQEIHRVLKDNGRLVVGVPGTCGYAADSDHKVFYDEFMLTSLLRQYGFDCKKVFHMPFRSKWLNQRISQYCIYGVYQKNSPLKE